MVAIFRRRSTVAPLHNVPSPTFLAAGESLVIELERSLPAYLDGLLANRLSDQKDPTPADLSLIESRTREVALGLCQELRQFVQLDVDAQRSTPLGIISGYVPPLTRLGHELGMVPVHRDRFLQERFPGDAYDLTPANLAVIDDAVGEAALLWGAAKAFEHKNRHRGTTR